MTEPVVHSIICPHIIGRDSQRSAMLQLLARAHSGQGQTLLLAGEAGIGKTRLVNDLAVHATQQKFAVVSARAFEMDSATPCALLSELLRSILTRHSAAEIIQALGPSASEVANLAPELHALLPTPLPSNSAEGDKRRLFEAILATLLFSSKQSPFIATLIVIEDAQWCDNTSLDFLLFLARKVVTYPILLLITYRDNEVGVALQRLQAALERERLIVEIPLARLTKAETGAMLRALLDLPPSQQDTLLDALYSLTGGNPFFVEEVLKSCLASGQIFQSEGRWGHKGLAELHIPRTIQVAVTQRVEQMTPAAQQLLKVAAVIGQRFDFALLQQAINEDEMSLVTLLKELIAAQLLVEEEADRFAFRHALTRQAILYTLLARERRALHRVVAETLERQPQSDSYLPELAYHFYSAAEWPKTWLYARRAGERAQFLFAPRAVVEHFSHAMEAASHLGDPNQARLDDLDSVPLYRARGRAYETLGEFDAARADFEQTLALAQSRPQSHAEWQSLLDLGFLWTSRDFGQARDYFQKALLVARALNEPALLAQSLNRLGNCYVNNEQPFLGRHYHAEALAIFQTLGDQSGLAATLDLLGGATHLAGDPQQSMRYYDEATTLFRLLKEQRGLTSTLTWYTFRGPIAINLLTPVAALPQCVINAQEARQLARDIQWRAGEAFAMIALGFALSGQGHYGEAITTLENAIKLAQEIDHRWDTVGYIALATIYLDLGLPAKAQELLAAGLAMTTDHNIHFSLCMNTAQRAATHLAQGQSAQARSVLVPAFGAEKSAYPSPNEPAPTMAQRLYWRLRAEIAIAEGRGAEALAVADHLLATSGAGDSSPQKAVSRLLIVRGDALLALQRPAEAEQAFLQALEAATVQGARPLIWRLHQRLGQLGKQGGDRTQALAHFDAARTEIDHLAATLPDPSLRHHFLTYALTQLPAAPTLTPLRARKQYVDGLTAREVEVALLIQRGNSDREIGEILSLSTRTVSTHVSNILTKLNYSTRAQIAAWAATKGM